MFNVEIKINGNPVAFIYGRNIEELANGKHRYHWEYYQPELGELVKGTIDHKREGGIRALITAILKKTGG